MQSKSKPTKAKVQAALDQCKSRILEAVPNCTDALSHAVDALLVHGTLDSWQQQAVLWATAL